MQEQAWAALAGQPFAILLDKHNAVVKPFSTLQLRLCCLSSCPGTYTSQLRFAIGTLPVRTFGIRAGICGTAVHVQSAGNLVAGLNTANTSSLVLPNGGVPRGVQITRCFGLFNVTSEEVDIELQLKTVPQWPQLKNIAVDIKPQSGGRSAVHLRYAHLASLPRSLIPNKAASRRRCTVHCLLLSQWKLCDRSLQRLADLLLELYICCAPSKQVSACKLMKHHLLAGLCWTRAHQQVQLASSCSRSAPA